MQTPFARLAQRSLHNFRGNAGNLDIHLKCGNTIFGTRHFEVHITQMIFVAQNIRQHCKTVAFLDQPHCDSRHMRFHRHACVHQG